MSAADETSGSITLRLADEADLDTVRVLFLEYAAELGVDLSFQGFEAELAGLPGSYAPPRGCILLGILKNAIEGVVALRPLSPEICEMKRLYVRAAARHSGLGRALASQIVREGELRGYRKMVLDTLPRLESAVRLYQSLGFQPSEPYYSNPYGALFFERFLNTEMSPTFLPQYGRPD